MRCAIFCVILLGPTISFFQEKNQGRPNAKNAASDQEELLRLPFREDFTGVKEGSLPAKWSGDNSVAVRYRKKVPRLEAADEGIHEARSPRVDIQKDFRLDLQATVAFRNKLEVTLKGSQGKPDLTLSFVEPVFSSTEWTVRMDNGTAQNIKVRSDRPNHIRLEREGDVYRLFVNDLNESVVAKRMQTFGNFDRVVFNLTGPKTQPVQSSGTSIHEITVKPIAKDETDSNGKRQPMDGK